MLLLFFTQLVLAACALSEPPAASQCSSFLPVEVLGATFQYLPLSDFIQTAQTSHLFYSAAQHAALCYVPYLANKNIGPRIADGSFLHFLSTEKSLLRFFKNIVFHNNGFTGVSLGMLLEGLSMLCEIEVTEKNWGPQIEIESYFAIESWKRRREINKSSERFMKPSEYTVKSIVIGPFVWPDLKDSKVEIDLSCFLVPVPQSASIGFDTNNAVRREVLRLLTPSNAQIDHMSDYRWQITQYEQEANEFKEQGRNEAEFPDFERWRLFRGLPVARNEVHP